MSSGLICDNYMVGIMRFARNESTWSLQCNMINSGRKRHATRKGGAPDMVCTMGKGSNDCDGGAWNEIEGGNSRPRSTYPAEQPIHAAHCQQGMEVNCMK